VAASGKDSDSVTCGRCSGHRVVVAALLDDRDTLKKMAHTAHGQAFEVFSVRRYVDQHTRLYDNLLANRSPRRGHHRLRLCDMNGD